jgi:penicillin-binding protein 2
MGKPSGLKQSCSVLCLLLVGALGVAFGAPVRRPTRNVRHHRVYRHRRYYRASYVDPSKGDVTTYDDPIVRQIAVEALGHQSGSVVAVNPENGRILAIVNQKMAFSSALEPCSTIKPFVTIAALKEDVITGDTMLRVAPRRYMNLTEALAHSNNEFFQQLGGRLGFSTVHHYDSLFGLGERAGYGIEDEQPGVLPAAPPAYGGVERMCSFGEGIRMTPLQLAAIVSTIANGGTLYYLQYPQSAEAVQDFQPRVRRTLAIAPLLPDLRQGMLAAVLYGTARLSNDPDGEQALGKTGTCNDPTMGGRLGWFASYAGQENPKIVLVVLLRGLQRIVNGPHAADVAGKIYRGLYQEKYFVSKPADSAAASASTSGTQR